MNDKNNDDNNNKSVGTKTKQKKKQIKKLTILYSKKKENKGRQTTGTDYLWLQA